MEARAYLEALEAVQRELQTIYETVDEDYSSLMVEDVQLIINKCVEVERVCQSIRSFITPTLSP